MLLQIELYRSDKSSGMYSKKSVRRNRQDEKEKDKKVSKDGERSRHAQAVNAGRIYAN